MDSLTALRFRRVYVSWAEQWDLESYVEYYLKSRGRPRNENERYRVVACLARYPGRTPVTKADLDYFLDANLAKPAAHS